MDAGTGILNVNVDRPEESTVNILLTHLHMDHIQGLGFFRPLFNPKLTVNIYGPESSGESLFTRLNTFLSPPLFPVPLRDIPSNLKIHEIGHSEFEIGRFRIKSGFISHPGPTVGYRISTDSGSLCYIPDHEPMIGSFEIFNDDDWISGYDLAKDSDILIHDAQYTADEYKDRIGWGHSSYSTAANLSSRVGAKKLILFHHDPSHTDSQLNEMITQFRSSNNYEFNIEPAIQGASIDYNT